MEFVVTSDSLKHFTPPVLNVDACKEIKESLDTNGYAVIQVMNQAQTKRVLGMFEN